MDVIVKLYAKKLIKDQIYADGCKPSYYRQDQIDNAVEQVAKMPGIKDKAYAWFNSDKA